MDWYSRKVLSWRLSSSMEAYFCVEALIEAIAKYGAPEIMNIDQGSQFTGFEWTQALKEADVKISPPTHVNMRCRTVHGWQRSLDPLSSLQAATAGQRTTV